MRSMNYPRIIMAIMVVDHPLATALDIVLVSIRLDISKGLMDHTIRNPIPLFLMQNGDAAKKMICVPDVANLAIGNMIVLCEDPMSSVLKGPLNVVLKNPKKGTRKGLLFMQLSLAHVQTRETPVLRPL